MYQAFVETTGRFAILKDFRWKRSGQYAMMFNGVCMLFSAVKSWVSLHIPQGAGFTDSGITFPLTLNAGQTATLNIEFDPAATGAVTGQLTLASNS
jgi:hypothetical protein